MHRRLVVLMTVMLAVPAAAQQPQADRNDPRAVARHGFGEVTGWVLRAAEMASAEQLRYQPVATVRTLGQLIGHIADSHNYYCAQAAGRNVEWTDPIEKTVTDKAALVQALRRSIDECGPVYASGTARIDQLLANLTHDYQHYGNIVTYLRMQGLTPPSN